MENIKISTLSNRFKLSSKTLSRAFAGLKAKIPERLNLKEVVVLADASYYGNQYSFGVVVFKDGLSGKFLWWKFIYQKERIIDYLQGLDFLRHCGYTVIAVVSDGLRGLSKAISLVPFQFCQFHAQNYAKIKLTNNPKTEAGINLLRISKKLSCCSSAEFNGLLNNFYSEFGDFLQEKSINKRQNFLHPQKAKKCLF